MNYFLFYSYFLTTLLCDVKERNDKLINEKLSPFYSSCKIIDHDLSKYRRQSKINYNTK